ncbi:MAG: phosphoribosyltransferase family protein [Pseudomonadota bacterium]
MIFKDRRHAGQLLSQKLQGDIKDSVIVLALPRGGVPVAAQIANALAGPLDVLIVRKVGAPNQAELAVGAVCDEAEPVGNQAILAKLGLVSAE